MPDVEEEGPPPGTFVQAIERIVEGGLLRLLVSKPVQQAIGRLISGTTDVPVAYLERWSQTVRSDTAARKQITSTIASAARAVAAKDPELVDRALGRWTQQLQAKQKTREDIASRTLNVLAEDEAALEGVAPTEDFMRMFEDIAERASSDGLADLMARILAGEIRQPGSVSRRTLQVATVLDQEIVGVLNDLKPYLMGDPGWVHVPPSSREHWRRRFSLLSSVSISNEVGIRVLAPFDEHHRSLMRVGEKMIVVTAYAAILGRYVDGANLTPIGQELVSVLPLPSDLKYKEIALGIKEQDFVERVEIGDISNIDDEFRVLNLQEII
jgi:hypothetical protein